MKNFRIDKIAVVGTGTLGVQIALMASYYGGQVKVFDPDEKSFDRVLGVIRQRMANADRKTLPPFENLEAGARKIQRCVSLKEAVAEAELVIEAVPENIELKRKIFQQMDLLSPREAIPATNSSSIPVSKIESATNRPEKCLNLHFYSPDLGKNMVDIMGGTKTNTETMEAGKRWIRSINCVPLPVKKELLGFCFNRVWRAIKRESLHMWAGGHVDFRDIDRGYMIWNGVSQGPFAVMDQVGLDVVYGIEMVYYNESKDPKDFPPDALKKMIERKDAACEKVGLGGRIFHDFRRTVVRNMIRSGVSEKTAMQITGHRTRAVFDRYNIVSETDIKKASEKIENNYKTTTMAQNETASELAVVCGSA